MDGSVKACYLPRAHGKEQWGTFSEIASADRAIEEAFVSGHRMVMPVTAALNALMLEGERSEGSTKQAIAGEEVGPNLLEP